METLFPISPAFPPGFSYFPDFLSVHEEEMLIRAAAGADLHAFLFRGYEARRRVRSFGFDYHFDSRSVSKGEPFPKEFEFLVNKVAEKLGLAPAKFEELLLTEYPIGSVINWHRDAPPFGLIAGISLLSDCKFRMRPYDKAKQKRGAVISFPVQRRSLYVMQDEAREEWEHSIAEMKARRYSITLRTMR